MSRILFAANHLFVASYFVGHVVGSRPMKRKEKIHRMIIIMIIIIIIMIIIIIIIYKKVRIIRAVSLVNSCVQAQL